MPFLKSSTPPKKSAKLAGKTPPSKKGKSAPKHKASAQPQREPTWWESLSPERKLDVVGIVLVFIGIIIFFGLISANRSVVIGGMISLLARLFGWGLFILPLGLLVFGLWLVLRKVERIPRIDPERAIGSGILFLWLLAVLHSLAATPETAEAVALTGAGGGALGALFMRFLWGALGAVVASIALLAWLIIG
ncbi:MAG TPA: DNA translocase FtsK 4TM domain-containing protein, partial [Anaerolineales bacterium]|nr:DNA translocase FtsK 4TM domain-containing protein [Anaerolineales bacterium]